MIKIVRSENYPTDFFGDDFFTDLAGDDTEAMKHLKVHILEERSRYLMKLHSQRAKREVVHISLEQLFLTVHIEINNLVTGNGDLDRNQKHVERCFELPYDSDLSQVKAVHHGQNIIITVPKTHPKSKALASVR
eukprot:augustus_masked-scaffold_78-processed-gene-0.14-mRNA-1 protein AED:1.00 eAED:1.00 QI:0/-1/0/0/-1/1/1/0/133